MEPGKSLIFAVFILFKLVSESQTNAIYNNQITIDENEEKIAKDSFEVKKIPFSITKKQSKVSGKNLLDKKNRPPVFKFDWNDPDVQHVHSYAAMTAILNCSAKGWPRPQVIWYKDGEELIIPEQRM